MENIKQRKEVEYELKDLKIIQKKNEILTGQIELKSLEGINILYPNQEDCGKRIKLIFNCRSHVNCLVYGMTQTGKTGCMTALIQHYILSNNIPIDNIYIITGLSDKEWKKDTKNRMPDSINVFHRANLPKTFLKDIREKKNNLIIMDEIQIACKDDQTIHKTFKECGFYDLDFLLENDIKLIQFSATPDGNMNDILDWKHHSAKVQLEPGEGYYGPKQAIEQKRVKQFQDLTILDNVEELKECIEGNFTNPRYHLVRVHKKNNTNPEKDKQIQVINNFKYVFGGNYEYNKNYLKTKKNDINDILTKQPEKHTFIFICETYRCAKTIEKKFIGILYERYTFNPDDSTIIQGLFGRDTGYNNNGDSICYTNISSLENYIQLWENDMDFKEGIVWNTKTTHYDKNDDLTYSTGTFNSVINIEQLKDNCSEKVISEDQIKPTILKRKTFSEIKLFFKDNKHLGRGPKNKTPNQNNFYECITQIDKSYKVRERKYFEKIEKDNNWGFKSGDSKNKYRCYCCYLDINDPNTLEWWLIYYEK